MRLSKRRTAYAAVLGLGLTFLILDRTVLDSGVSGPASESAAEPAGAARASLIGAEALDKGLTALSVGQRLEKFRRTREGAGIADAFAAVGGWFEKAAHGSKPANAPDPVEFRLTSVSGNLATVNGVVLRPGRDTEVTLLKNTQRTALVRLVSSGNRRAVIETDGRHLELTVAQPDNELPRK